MSEVEGVEGLSTIAPPDHLVTHDRQRTDHIISDEHLMILAYGGQDKSFDILVAAVGVAFGFAQNFAAAAVSVMKGQAAGLGDFVGAAIFVCAFTTTIVAFYYWKKVAGGAEDLVMKIKSRQIEVTPAMIEAGANAAWADGAPPMIVRDIVERVYRAMERVRREEADHSPA